MRIEWLVGILAITLLMVPSAYGQYYGEVYSPPICVSPPTTLYCPPSTDYILNRNQSFGDQRILRKVNYDNAGWLTVPVINGYVPEVRYVGSKTIYDYREGWLLSNVQYEGKLARETAPPPRVKETRSYDPPPKAAIIEESDMPTSGGRELPPVPRKSTAPPKAAIEEFSEHDRTPWRSGLKRPADDGWRAAPPKTIPEDIPLLPPKQQREEEQQKPTAPSPPIDLSKSPYRSLLPPDQTPSAGMRLPGKIEEPEKRIVPKYDEKK